MNRRTPLTSLALLLGLLLTGAALATVPKGTTLSTPTSPTSRYRLQIKVAGNGKRVQWVKATVKTKCVDQNGAPSNPLTFYEQLPAAPIKHGSFRVRGKRITVSGRFSSSGALKGVVSERSTEQRGKLIAAQGPPPPPNPNGGRATPETDYCTGGPYHFSAKP